MLQAIRGSDWFGLFVVALVAGAALAVFQPAFLSPFNLYVLLISFSLWALVAMAQMVIIAIGQMNLSVGAIGGLVAISFAGSRRPSPPVPRPSCYARHRRPLRPPERA